MQWPRRGARRPLGMSPAFAGSDVLQVGGVRAELNCRMTGQPVSQNQTEGRNPHESGVRSAVCVSV